jgi:diguanylate cyclase (GGDEF)-like protein
LIELVGAGNQQPKRSSRVRIKQWDATGSVTRRRGSRFSRGPTLSMRQTAPDLGRADAMGSGGLALRRPSLPASVWYATVIAGWLLIGLSVGTIAVHGIAGAGPALLMIGALVVVLELRPVVVSGEHDPQGVTLATAFVFAILFMWGLGPAVVAMTVATLSGELHKRKPAYKLFFNVAQYDLSVAAAWSVLHLTGVEPHLGLAVAHLDGRDLASMVLSWIVYFTVNNLLVSGVLADGFADFVEVFCEDFGYHAVTTAAVLMLSPIVIVVAGVSWVVLPLLLLPLWLVYRTAQMSLEKEHQAHHDALTGLPNRKLLAQRLDDAVSARHRDAGRCALLMLDLDRFKEVNDTLGHQAGDRLLEEIARRLRGALRQGDTVARLGGDEFAVVLPEVRDADEAVGLARRLLTVFDEPVRLDGLLLAVDVSIGVSVFPQHGTGAEELMLRADVAMYDAKEHQRGIATYEVERDRNSPDRLGLLGELRAALDDGGAGLELHYQPKVALGDDCTPYGALLGVEALLRWHHPERGNVAPDEFIPLAERSGLMHDVTRHVLRQALAQAAAWRSAGLDVPVAVNVSVVDLDGGRLLDVVAATLAAHGLPGSILELEITERLLGGASDALGDVLDGLRALGVRLTLDDFGTGYSSLVRLREVPVAELKIDQRFTARIATDDVDRALVRGIIDLAHALGLPVVAEGVERPEQRDLLRALGCDAGQGWLFAHPMPAARMTAWVHEHQLVAPLAS